MTWKSHTTRAYRHRLLFYQVLCSAYRNSWFGHREVFILFYWILSLDYIVLSPFLLLWTEHMFGFLYPWFHNCLRDMRLCCGSTSCITSSFDYFVLRDRPFGFYTHCGYFCWRYNPVGSSVVQLYACDSWP